MEGDSASIGGVERSSARWFAPAFAVAIVAATLIAYSPAIDGEFIWDDDQYVSENAALASPGGLRRIWTDPAASPQYYPLVFTTFWIERRLWGLSTVGYHAVNALLHALNALLLWRVLRRLRVPGAALAGAVFALHPVHVESVAWITERKNVLSGFFYLSSLLAYLRVLEGDGALPRDARHPPAARPAYYVALLLYGAALLSKSVACTLPVIILLLVYWKSGRARRLDLARLVPFFALGLLAGLNTLNLERGHVGASGAEWDLTPPQRFTVAGRALGFYLFKLFWPSRLSFVYPRWEVGEFGPLALLTPPIAAVGVVVALHAVRRRIGRAPLVAALAFIVTLGPALGFVNVFPFRYSFVADHFQYLASAAPIALLAAGATKIMPRIFRTTDRGRPPWEIGILVLLGALTMAQASIYRSRETLWTAVLKRNPDAAIAYNNLGTYYLEMGRFQDAERTLKAGAERIPDDGDLWGNLGVARLELNRPADAEASLDRALALDPGNPWWRTTRANALARSDRAEAAIEALNALLTDRPDWIEAYNALAMIQADRGRMAEAIATLERALRVAPGHPILIENLRALRRTPPP